MHATIRRYDGVDETRTAELTRKANEHLVGLPLWKKDGGRASMTDKQKALIGRYAQLSDISNVPFKTSPPPAPYPVAAEVPQPSHYWYERRSIRPREV